MDPIVVNEESVERFKENLIDLWLNLIKITTTGVEVFRTLSSSLKELIELELTRLNEFMPPQAENVPQELSQKKPCSCPPDNENEEDEEEEAQEEGKLAPKMSLGTSTSQLTQAQKAKVLLFRLLKSAANLTDPLATAAPPNVAMPHRHSLP